MTVVDFMPLRNGHSELVRIVIGRRGTVRMNMELVLRFDYGLATPWVSRLLDDSGIRVITGPDLAVLRTPVDLVGENMRTTRLLRGQRRRARALLAVPIRSRICACRTRPTHTRNSARTDWREWSGQNELKGRYAPSAARLSR